MSEHPGRSAPDSSDLHMSATHPGPRRIGDFLLVAQLGDDALGSVYRALHTEDGRFVRLRVLQSPELSPSATLEAAERQVARRSLERAGDVARHGELRVAQGTPYLVWPDNNGWTLDFVLARARAGGWGMPIEFALLIAERAAAEIEKTCLSSPVSEPPFHGVLWPGFVGLSSDAEVRVEGFGLADAVLPVLSKPRMWRDVAPYVAPEARENPRVAQTSDVYSLGVLLAELLTGSRATADAPPPRWRADDDFSQEVSLLLRFALGHPRERFSTMAELHASLKDLITACPFEPLPADLALFLYDLLNPESQCLPAPFDGNSTNPVAAEHRSPGLLSPAPVLAPPPPARLVRSWMRRSRIERPRARRAAAEPAVFGAGAPPRTVSLVRSVSRAAAIAAAIVALAAIDLPIRPQSPPAAPVARIIPAQTAPEPVLVASTSAARLLPAPDSAQRPSIAGFSTASRRIAVSESRSPVRHRTEEREETETLRLKTALARIEAERLDATQHAEDAFESGRRIEREAEGLLSHRRYVEARGAYAQALELFAAARSRSQEERVRQIQIAGDVESR